MGEFESKGIALAVEIAGSQRGLAECLGVTQQAVSEWVHQGFAPKHRVHDILDNLDPDCTVLSVRDLMDPKLVALLDRG